MLKYFAKFYSAKEQTYKKKHCTYSFIIYFFNFKSIHVFFIKSMLQPILIYNHKYICSLNVNIRFGFNVKDQSW